MITIKRIDKMSINMEFDKTGLKDLIKAFNDVTIKKPISNIDVVFDLSILTLKKQRFENKTITFEYVEDTCTKLVRKESEIRWLIDKEDIENAKELLEISLEKGYFSPAEFIRVQVTKNKNLDYMYCKIVD